MNENDKEVRDKMTDAENINRIVETIKDIEFSSGEKWAIYGTGKGSELLYKTLCKFSIDDIIKVIIERDEKVYSGREFYGIPVKKLTEVADLLDGILIAAIDYHKIIQKRILNSLTEKQLKHIQVIDVFGYYTKAELMEYVEYIEKSILGEKKDFVEFDEREYRARKGDTKIIAWYLPQFHQIEINNQFHGRGFTEWTNTSKMIPMFTGHYQPQIPYDVGYYDLLNPNTLRRQIDLAKHYGVYGFCFHYYWFSGKKIMEKPLNLLFKLKELNMPFCLNWATENWTALWDGENKEIMLRQEYNEGDDARFMDDILPYMKDPRYIKIHEKPVLIIYRIDQFEKTCAKHMLDNFRKIAQSHGFPDLYIMFTTAFKNRNEIKEWGGDALVEFPPHILWDCMDKYNPDGYLNPWFKGRILDASSFVREKKYMITYKTQTYFRSALTSWDNSARKAISGACILYGLNPKTFKKWLSDIVEESQKIHSEEENIVFVNSWNEWGEGSHLEPDIKYGYAYLKALKDVLERR